MKKFVGDIKANEQINKIYVYVKKQMSDKEIAAVFEKNNEINLKNNNSSWHTDDIKMIRENFKLNSNKILTQKEISIKNEIQKIIVTDIKMPFESMVFFMVKWVIASIPAFIILIILGAIAFGIFGGLLSRI